MEGPAAEDPRLCMPLLYRFVRLPPLPAQGVAQALCSAVEKATSVPAVRFLAIWADAKAKPAATPAREALKVYAWATPIPRPAPRGHRVLVGRKEDEGPALGLAALDGGGHGLPGEGL